MSKYLAIALILSTAVPTISRADTEVPNGLNKTMVSRFAGPSAVVFNSTLYVFAGKNYQSTVGSSWSPVASVPQCLASEPGCALYLGGESRATVFDNKLYLFWTSGTYIAYAWMDQYGNWSGQSTSPGAFTYVVPGASAERSPGVAVYNGRLYVMWQSSGSSNNLYYASMDTARNWSGTARLSTGASSAGPAATVFRKADGVDYMYAVWKDTFCYDCSDRIWYAYMGPSGVWSATARLDTGDYPLTAREPTIAASDSKLWVIYRGGHNADLLFKTMDQNGNWALEQTFSPSATDYAPGATFFNGAIWSFHFGGNENLWYYLLY